jgi:phage tail tape-measure protein
MPYEAVALAGMLGLVGAVILSTAARAHAYVKAELAVTQRELEETRADRAYWKARAELAIDASLARAGTTPIMMAHRHQGLDPAAALRGLSMTSIPRAEDRPST